MSQVGQGTRTRTIGARWILPGTAPPIRDGSITINGERIVRVGPADPSAPLDLDLGSVAIVPGFVNMHTHLELGPDPWDEASGPEAEVEWLGRVIRSRLDRLPEAVADLIRLNVAAAVAAGTTALADITTSGQSWAAVAGAPVWGTVCAEVLGLSDFRSHQTWQAATAWLATLSPPTSTDQTRPGLSPHAPYSTAGWLYQAAADSGLPLTTHLGEMPEEREFLTSRSGPLRQFVEGLGAWTDTWQPVGPAPADYVTSHPADWIIAHANIFEPAEYRRFVPDQADPLSPRVAIAYCPRTHARFGHPPHPFRAMLAAGVVVCLGTDSLASAPSLSILDEIRFLHRHHPDVPGAVLLRMATIGGAWALRRDDQTGSLEPGKSADLAILALGAKADPYLGWLEDESSPLGTMFRGEFVAGSITPPR